MSAAIAASRPTSASSWELFLVLLLAALGMAFAGCVISQRLHLAGSHHSL
jgi:hypothetical protein